MSMWSPANYGGMQQPYAQQSGYTSAPAPAPSYNTYSPSDAYSSNYSPSYSNFSPSDAYSSNYSPSDYNSYSNYSPSSASNYSPTSYDSNSYAPTETYSPTSYSNYSPVYSPTSSNTYSPTNYSKANYKGGTSIFSPRYNYSYTYPTTYQQMPAPAPMVCPPPQQQCPQQDQDSTILIQLIIQLLQQACSSSNSSSTSNTNTDNNTDNTDCDNNIDTDNTDCDDTDTDNSVDDDTDTDTDTDDSDTTDTTGNTSVWGDPHFVAKDGSTADYQADVGEIDQLVKLSGGQGITAEAAPYYSPDLTAKQGKQSTVFSKAVFNLGDDVRVRLDAQAQKAYQVDGAGNILGTLTDGQTISNGDSSVTYTGGNINYHLKNGNSDITGTTKNNQNNGQHFLDTSITNATGTFGGILPALKDHLDPASVDPRTGAGMFKPGADGKDRVGKTFAVDSLYV